MDVMALLPSFGNYSKVINGAIGAVVGVLVSIGVSALIHNVPSLGTCVVAALPDDPTHQVCTLLGFTDAKISEALVAMITLLFVHQSPPNNVG